MQDWTEAHAVVTREFLKSSAGVALLHNLREAKTKPTASNLEQVGMQALVAQGEQNTIDRIEAAASLKSSQSQDPGFIDVT